MSGAVVVDGSSTVEPLSSAAAELFQGENPDVNVTVGTSGTGGGFQKFCAGETDISNASRAISDSEKELCKAAGISYEELQVANDALTVVMNKENTWATCLTVEQLKSIWEPASTVKNWNEVDPSFPDQALTLYGAGPDSGTFDYFTGAIMGEEGESRTDYNPTEDDNVTVQGVSGSVGRWDTSGSPTTRRTRTSSPPWRSTAAPVASGHRRRQRRTARTPRCRGLCSSTRPTRAWPSRRLRRSSSSTGEQQKIVTSAQFIPLTPPQLAEQQAALEGSRRPPPAVEAGIERLYHVRRLTDADFRICPGTAADSSGIRPPV